MVRFTTLVLSAVIYVCIFQVINAQNTFVSGKVIDSETGDPIPFCHIFVKNTQSGTIADSVGFFTLKISSINDSIKVSFIGYSHTEFTVEHFISQSNPVVYLAPINTNLKEVAVYGQRLNKNQVIKEISNNKYTIDAAQLNNLPSLTGEADIIKSLTLLPGTVKGIEGSSDIFVRGGDADQNLIIFNGAPVFTTGHLFGFLSVFNPEVIENVSLYTGAFPAKYGGRLSSIIDINSKPLDQDHWNYKVNLGTISSSIKAEGPVFKDKINILIAGRRTYIDQLGTLFNFDVPYFFYDLNAQLDFKINKNFTASYHFYMGEDVMKLRRNRNDSSENKTDFILQNYTHTLKIRGNLNRKLLSILNIYVTEFKYKINSKFEDNILSAVSDLKEYGIKHHLQLKSNVFSQFNFGYEIINHDISPNLINTSGEISSYLPSSSGKSKEVIEWSAYSDIQFQKSKFTLDIGMRLSNVILSKNIFYFNPEPRVSITLDASDNLAFNSSYSRMVQYLHRVSSSAFTLPTDLWYPVTTSIRPQIADQLNFGMIWSSKKIPLVIKSDLFYKKMNNLIEFEEGTNLTLNNDFESRLIQGQGNSYGWEIFLQKTQGKWLSNLSYTLSWSNRQFDKINNGEEFRARYDRRHNLIFTNQYNINNKWNVSAVWEFISGARFTPILGYYATINSSMTGIDLIPQYPKRNSVSLNDTHRLDLNISFSPETKRNIDWKFMLNLYNVYNRTSPVAIDVVYDTNSGKYKYEQPGLLGFLPTLNIIAEF
ncbi:TonB-dependent receptor [Marinigracilibium pacificum]|uniref:TonB-dependent receptor plug domain-containing protein n=1 Tax=Marinigracilibium pacificum TaxID=2729599 RepID=A0A848J2N8_9BACT|nr:carboxypeptidase-like regulatory domain-containing protein [Marinigracilibium pacificum]NMM50036.1 TonB-dependent receptor plug domain-containing protein [Marinigracilibium pacificum]